MILQALYRLYDRLAMDPDYGIAEPGYSVQKVSFSVVLTPDGRLHGFSDERVEQVVPGPGGKEKRVQKPRQLRLPGQTKKPGTGFNPGFLWDNTRYMLGFDPTDKDPERTQSSFLDFRKRHLDMEKEIDDPAFSAVCRFLESWSPEEAACHEILARVGTHSGVFRIQGETGYLHELPRMRQWWQENQSVFGKPASFRGMCLVSGGENLPIAQTHEPKIKGVRHAQAESLLVSFVVPFW